MSDVLPAVSRDEPHFRELFKLSKRLVASLDLNEIGQITVEGVATLAGLDTAAIYLTQGDMLRLQNTTPPLPLQFPDDLRNASLADHPYIQQAITTSAPVFIPDASTAVLSAAEQSVFTIRNLCTVLFLPLIAESEVLGAFIVGSVGVCKPITEDQIDLSYMLANLAALAVKNARLFQQRQQYAAKLEQTLEERKKAEAERERLREQLLQVQKMDAIGQLAGGIAHDFNNMLCGIIGSAELIKGAAAEAEIIQFAEEIITLGQRSGELTSQLLAFSRKGQIKCIPVALDTLAQEVVTILSRTISRNIEIKTDFNAFSCYTRGDPAQIQNTILNLGVNARDAMPDGGMLVMQTCCVDLTAENCSAIAVDLVPGRYLELSVTDTGVGMDTVTREHMYEPFFTTKKRGEGTGMGLSAVYGTMMTLGGAITVESSPGEGTTFKLHFPVDNQETSADTGEPQGGDDRNAYGAEHRMQKILLVDDEEILTGIATRHLQTAGYNVLAFTDSLAALSYFTANHAVVALVILDLVMPGMDGVSLYRAIKAIKPEVGVILSSGFSIDSASQTLFRDGKLVFIQKPYLRNELIAAVGSVLKTLG